MVFSRRALSFTLRERRGIVVPLGLWALVTAVATLTGPFQTYEVLPLLPRMAYWGLIAALSVGLSLGLTRLLQGRGKLWRRAGWVPFALSLAAIVQAVNRVVFGGWASWADYLWLVGVVLVVCLLIELGLALFAPPARREEIAADPPDRAFLNRLPLERRGPLIRIEAQDHYLSVVTEAGTALILMRLSDAETMLQDAGGLRVHRSHWVRCAAVQAHRRREGRDILVMQDGSEVPVSRGNRAAVMEAGLIPSARG
ncbi:MAG: LytTR family DNA-binding domain-containing protein [Rhodobacterales bacterium]